MTFENKWLGKTQEQVNELSEADIEKKVCNYAKGKGYVVDKFTSPSKRSVPDRLFTPPCGVMFLIEFKKRGKKPTEKQALDHEKRRKNNVFVYVVDDVEQGKQIIDHWLTFNAYQITTT